MVPGDGKRLCVLIGAGPQTGDTMWKIEGIAYPVIVGPAMSHIAPQAPPEIEAEAPAPKKMSWKAQQRQLPKFLR